MKEFLRVTAKNFFSYGPKEQTLELSGKDIWNINGLNGKGKTTICIEAITFAIFGKHREDKIDECVNRDIGSDCKVSLEFVGDDDKIYKIIRYRKHGVHGNAVYLFKGDEDISCKNAKDTDALIQETVGMPYIAFVNSTLFSSELYSNFLKTKNSDRLVVFENILSLKEVSVFYAETKKVLKELEDAEESATINYSSAKAERELLSKTIEDYNSQAKAKLIELKSQKEAAKQAKAASEEKIKELSVIDVDAEKTKLNNNKLVEEYNKQIKEKESLKNSYSAVKPILEYDTVEKYKDVDFEENAKKEQKYKEDSETIKTRQNGCDQAMSLIRSLTSEKSVLETKISNANKDLEEQQANLEKVKESICPFCGQKMNEEETQKKKDIINKLIKVAIDEKEEAEEELKEKELTLKEQNESYNFLIGEVNRLKENLDNKFIPNTELIKEKYTNALNVIKNYEEAEKEYEVKRNQLDEEIKQITLKINSLETSKYTLADIENIAGNIAAEEEKIKQADIVISTVDGSVKTVYNKEYVEKMKSDLNEKQEIEENAKNDVNNVLHEKALYETLSECFSNKSGGFKKYFINEMIPLFNEKINQYLPFFFNDKKIEISFDKDLNETIKIDGKEVSYSSFSKGQKSRLDIAVSFALFTVSRIFFSNKSGLLVVDELLDNGLDEYGIKSAISVLDSFAEEAKVFVVSHNPVVKENIDNLIEIKTDENGFSLIV